MASVAASAQDERPISRKEISFWIGIITLIVSVVIAYSNISAQCQANSDHISRLESVLENHLKDTKLAGDIADIQMRMVRIETQLDYVRAAVDGEPKQ